MVYATKCCADNSFLEKHHIQKYKTILKALPSIYWVTIIYFHKKILIFDNAM